MDGTVDLDFPLEGTVAGGVTFRLPPRSPRENNWVDTDLGKVFGDVLGCRGAASSGPS